MMILTGAACRERLGLEGATVAKTFSLYCTATEVANPGC